MLALEKVLRVSHIKGADLNDDNPLAIVLKSLNPGLLGHKDPIESNQSFIFLDEKARKLLGLPSLLQLINHPLCIQLSALEVPGGKTHTWLKEWLNGLWTVWREDKDLCSKVFLNGLEKHEYVEYTDEHDFGDLDVYHKLSDEEKIRAHKTDTVAKKSSICVAYFSSAVPAGTRLWGGGAEPRLPSFSLALPISPEEYETLIGYLEKPVVFDIKVKYS